jgi:hypothetical protein
MYKLKQFVFILSAFFITYIKADQLALIDKANAIKAVEFLRLNSDVVLFCGCCDGDIKKKIHVYQAIYKQDPKYKEYYEVSITYEYQGDSIAGWEPLDLAYVHTKINGLWTPLGKVIGMECDPCVEPFVFEAQIPNNVTCTEKESPNQEGGDPLLTKTCLYKKYKIITQGYPDFKGRYSYEYSVFKKDQNGSYVQIKNAMLFNENKNELLSIINSKIKKDYMLFSNDPETKDCFEGSSFTPYNFDQLGIDFNADGIYFHVTFGLSGACMSVDGTIISFSLDEIKNYLNQ